MFCGETGLHARDFGSRYAASDGYESVANAADAYRHTEPLPLSQIERFRDEYFAAFDTQTSLENA